MDLSLERLHLFKSGLNLTPSILFNISEFLLQIFSRFSGFTNLFQSCVPIGSHLKIYSAPIIAKKRIKKIFLAKHQLKTLRNLKMKV